AVNISGRHLQHGELVDDVAQALRESGFEAGNLVIELTESTTMYNTDANLERFQRLKALGVKLAIDDFGTGYSSLSYLHRFPIDILKIDRSFVSRLTSSDNGPELARAVITLGETLGLDTVAGGAGLGTQVRRAHRLRGGRGGTSSSRRALRCSRAGVSPVRGSWSPRPVPSRIWPRVRSSRGATRCG